MLLGNVALASHGEKVTDEVLGDGDASVAFQKFELQKNPLTYIPSAGPGGTESTLQVMVNDILWTEVPSLFGRGPTDQVYTTRIADDGTVTVGFGEGRSGARLPSGRGNVVADYREGCRTRGPGYGGLTPDSAGSARRLEVRHQSLGSDWRGRSGVDRSGPRKCADHRPYFWPGRFSARLRGPGSLLRRGRQGVGHLGVEPRGPRRASDYRGARGTAFHPERSRPHSSEPQYPARSQPRSFLGQLRSSTRRDCGHCPRGAFLRCQQSRGGGKGRHF